MKLPEATALELFHKHGLTHPQFLVVSPNSPIHQLTGISKFVVKANIAAGGKKKGGLVAICELVNLEKTVQEILKKSTPELPFDSALVEEYIEHDKEYYLAIKAVREGVQVFFSESGGVEIEANWDRVRQIIVPTGELLITNYELQIKELVADKVIRDWLLSLIQFFRDEDATYLEINPLVLTSEYKVLPLGVVLELDEAAGYRHPDWPDGSLSSSLSSREKRVGEIDKEIKGSIKLVEVPILDTGYRIQNTNLTALLAAGAGAALYLADAIMDNGLALANYAEFSGNPPKFAITELTKQVCAIAGIKNLVIGSGIANFTDVVPNIEAIIEGLRLSPQSKQLRIVVRRCGPGEEEGMEMMRKFAKASGYNIQVFGRDTGMTDVVNKLVK